MLLRTRRPRVVVSVGGYASLPSVLAARRLRIPIVVVSYDRRPGRASRLAARLAAASAVSFPGSGLPRARRDRCTAAAGRCSRSTPPGTGPRRGRLSVCRPTASSSWSLAAPSARPCSTTPCGASWRRRRSARDLAVRHVVGERFLTDDDATAAARPARDGILYTVVGYEERMPQAYAATDLVVARAGASTVAELAAIGVPSILVPWPGAAADHQTDNARSLAAVGAAVLLPESRARRRPGWRARSSSSAPIRRRCRPWPPRPAPRARSTTAAGWPS